MSALGLWVALQFVLLLLVAPLGKQVNLLSRADLAGIYVLRARNWPCLADLCSASCRSAIDSPLQFGALKNKSDCRC
jgi:hypothetical protein